MDTEIQATDGKGDESGRKSKRTRTITVKIVDRQGKAVLVEWMDGDLYKRATVPGNKLKGNDCPENVLAQGVPYGLDWENVLSDWPGADVLANEFRRQGIWTTNDFFHGVTTVRGVINRIFVRSMMDEITEAIRSV